jgi:hypothetical protein
MSGTNTACGSGCPGCTKVKSVGIGIPVAAKLLDPGPIARLAALRNQAERKEEGVHHES